jgi:small subunit ribosomal protein S3
VIRDWQAKWYADKHYAEFLLEDMKLRKGLQQKYAEAAISLVEIERQANKVAISIHTSRPGIVIGRGGQRVDETRKFLEALVGKKIQLNIQEIQRPELDAVLVAKQIAEQMERRVAYRRAMKQTMMRTMQAGAKGMRVSCAGRLGGAEIARRLTMHEGQVPLHTLRADIDYGFVEANTQMGKIGVKVWIYKGDILPELKKEEAEEAVAEAVPVAVAVEAKMVEETPAPVAAEAAPVAVAEEAPKPAPRRRRTVPSKADVNVESAAEEKPAEAVEEAPKPATRRRTAKPAATTEPAADSAETKPAKPVTRRRTTKAETPPEPKEEAA